ncbi:unnamed protein product, partial [Mesorhabditis belari]|uniref:Major sperm protein n=1 Tax=Mesorhabditis belari TaxID=2138241 RepID=A0AAF3FJU6_9BILA
MRLFLRLINVFSIVQNKFCYAYSISEPTFNALDSMKHGVAAEFLERLSVFSTGNNHLWYQHFGLTIPHLSSYESGQGIQRIHLKAKRVYSGDEKHAIYQFPPIPQQKIICELMINEQKQRYNGICYVAKKILGGILSLQNPGLKLRTDESLQSPELVLNLRVRRKNEIECQRENDYSSCVLDHFLLPTGLLPGIIAPKFVNMTFCRPRNMMALFSAWPQTSGLQNCRNEPECQLTITPEKLEFFCIPVGKPIHLDVTLTNPTSENQTYKVKCTSNEVFRVTSPYGILASKASFKIRFYFQNKSIPDPTKVCHYFAIYHMKCPPTTVQTKVRELWAGKETKPDGVKRLPVTFFNK